MDLPPLGCSGTELDSFSDSNSFFVVGEVLPSVSGSLLELISVDTTVVVSTSPVFSGSSATLLSSSRVVFAAACGSLSVWLSSTSLNHLASKLLSFSNIPPVLWNSFSSTFSTKAATSSTGIPPPQSLVISLPVAPSFSTSSLFPSTIGEASTSLLSFSPSVSLDASGGSLSSTSAAFSPSSAGILSSLCFPA